MSNIKFSALGVLLFLFVSLVAFPWHNGEAGQRDVIQIHPAAIPGQAIVNLEAAKSVHDLAGDIDGRVLKSDPCKKNIYLISFPRDYTFDEIRDALKHNSGVISVRPNYRVALPEVNQGSDIFPDQSNPIYLEGSSPSAYYEQQSEGNVGSDSANMLATGRDVVVGIIDNGVEYYHPLFIYIDSITSDTTLDSTFADMGYDYVDDDSSAAEETGDAYGHGTFVTGIIRLVAPNCRVIPYRAFDDDGVGSSFDVSSAIYQAIEDGVDVLNMSFGLYSSDTSIADAVGEAYEAGIAMVASCGNDNTATPFYPASYTGVIAVSAIDSLDYPADFSNHGAYIDYCAPGVNVYSSLAGEYKWGIWSGTSFAAPQVTGICALILEWKPAYSSLQVDSLIRKTADTSLAWGSFTPHDSSYGYGRADAYEVALCLRRGDVDNSGTIDSSDIVYLNSYLTTSGPPPVPILKLGDVNCSGIINTLDVAYLINYLNSGGPAPCCGE
nr:S8 family serine peptidase [candidate division Zixibacteria bacterium]